MRKESDLTPIERYQILARYQCSFRRAMYKVWKLPTVSALDRDIKAARCQGAARYASYMAGAMKNRILRRG